MNRPTDISKLMTEILPPKDREHREGFSNKRLIDALCDSDRVLVERALIDALQEPVDTLIVETLLYMKSTLCIPRLYELLEQRLDEEIVITIASAVYGINHDDKMVALAVAAFHSMEANGPSYMRYRLPSLFNDLGSFRHHLTDDIIKQYVPSNEFVLSYNAQEALKRQ